jgi:hypothetical protein
MILPRPVMLQEQRSLRDGVAHLSSSWPLGMRLIELRKALVDDRRDPVTVAEGLRGGNGARIEAGVCARRRLLGRKCRSNCLRLLAPEPTQGCSAQDSSNQNHHDSVRGAGASTCLPDRCQACRRTSDGPDGTGKRWPPWWAAR